MLKSIRAQDAILGMYVQSFGGSWLSHPFWKAKFLISSPDELARIRASGVEVVIDTVRGCDIASQPANRHRPPPAGRFGRAGQVRVVDLAQRSTDVVKSLFDDCRLGRTVDTADILSTVDDIADVLIHDLSAFISVTRLKSKDDYTYMHSVAVCALMISLAQELGEPAKAVRELGMAGLLHDLGKVAVPDDILHKSDPLTAAEIAEVRRHTTHGHDMLSQTSDVPPVALDVALHHHERPDGTGYPFGLKGDAISRATRMASICNVYDALTSIRDDRKGLSPMEAITAMEASTGEFDPGLLFRFMRELGVYPVGKLVRFRSTHLAVTMPAVRDGLGPAFRTFYSTVDTRFVPYEDIILSNDRGNADAISAADPAAWFSADWPTMASSIVEGREIGRQDAA
ncbi:HD-GYP domain-containing protein [Sphingomonas mollis]|uniref:HD-GYP domain-containing protein n=1 Tax=Sphingomonas mollis TaxID=2795726 RepID=A0ABS0XPK2_9SPHN|nr:HD-GYP domain-containing protein [Sphingomonas sp. BT553]MBJ6121653.1 HD-GYP domain-containing protein [Sphingomonas sp. BT553]